jgi:hypothetical protein
MNDLHESIETLYSNRREFVVIGLTGRTGSGCSTTAKMLSDTINEIKIPKPLRSNQNEERKYRICYDFVHENWKPFIWVQIKDIIASFILDNNFESFKEYAVNVLSKGSISKDQVEKVLEEKIKEDYEVLHSYRLEIKALELLLN